MLPRCDGRKKDPLILFFNQGCRLEYPGSAVRLPCESVCHRIIDIPNPSAERNPDGAKKELWLFLLFLHLLKQAGLESIELGGSNGMALVDPHSIERYQGARIESVR
jgi:hypothetical protein